MQEEKIKQMLEMQNKLNIYTNGDNWIEGVTKEGRKIDWLKCIYMELAEFLDSFNWKHWKDIETPHDLENARMELVDIWHFVLSLLIEKDETEILGRIDFFNEDNGIIYDERAEIEAGRMVRLILNFREAKYLYDEEVVDYLYELLKIFNSLLTYTNLTFDQLHEIYTLKNWLNIFRQDNGYKEGTYKKMLRVENVHGEIEMKEDNEVLQGLVKGVGLEKAIEAFPKIYQRNVESWRA